MAYSCLRNYLRYSYITLRPLSYFEKAQKCLQFSTSGKISSKSSHVPPVKFTTSKGAKASIREIIGIENYENKSRFKYESYVVAASIVVLLAYFCIFREENDIDEMLKGSLSHNRSTAVELLNLKLRLSYCEKNNLPTEAIKARIKEIEMSNIIRSAFEK